jgi:signal transduction histidine kinase
METLLEVSYDLSTAPELTGLLDHLLRHLRNVVDFQRAAVMLVDDEGVLTTRAFYALDFPNVTTVQIPISAVPAFQRIFDQREMVYTPDIQADEASLEAFGQVVSESWFAAVAEMRTWLGVPLLVRDRVIGILSLLHTEPDRYGAGTQNLLRLFANQLAIAIENVRLYGRAQEIAVFEERARLARDLHDSVTQTLYSTNLFADATSLLLSELRPPLLQEVGLAGALQTRLESVEARVGLSIDFTAEGERQLPSNVEADLYHVALEALNNIAKHANAQQATVHLKMDEERCHLTIQDDGIGFDPEAAGQSGGHGLRNMQERVAQIGGRLSLETAPGRGTTVTIEVNA